MFIDSTEENSAKNLKKCKTVLRKKLNFNDHSEFPFVFVYNFPLFQKAEKLQELKS